MKDGKTAMKAMLTVLACAMLLFARAQDSGPNAGAMFKTAYGLYVQGYYDAALQSFNAAISVDPNRHYFYYNRGLTYKALKQSGAALADFQHSIDLKPTAEAYYQAGLIKYEKQDHNGALADFENAKLLKDDVDRLNFCLGMLYYRLERFEEALACFSAYTYQEKNQAEAYYYRGMSEAKVGKYTEAINSFKFALRYKDRDWTYYFKMYEFYLALNDKQNALNSLSMVIEIGEATLEFYEKRAALYKELGMDFKYEEDMAAIKKLGGSPAVAGAM